MRVATRLLCLAMLLSALVACGSSAATPPTAAPPAPTAPPTALPTPLSIQAAEARGPLFVPYGDGPVVPRGAITEWDGTFTDPGAVLYHDGAFHMFRNGFRGWPATVQVGYVTSPDGYTWTKQGAQPVLTTKEVAYAGIAMLASSALVQDDGTWVLYFYTWESAKPPVTGGIGRATAAAPTGPWRPDPALVLTHGPAGAWDENQVLAPHVLRTDQGYLMYYSGIDRSGAQMIGMARSNDGVSWTKYDDPATTDARFAQSDPVLQPGPADAWDGRFVHQPRVAQTADGWVMIYRGVPKLGTNKMALGAATSTDGVHWVRSPQNPLLTPKAVPKAEAFWFTSMVYHEGTYFLFWEVDMKHQTNIYLATFQGRF
jgi:hypothetical protein